MKAIEARRASIIAVSKELTDIETRISVEANKGHTQLSISGVSQGAIAYLKDEGYDITISYESAFSQVMIKW